MRYGTASNFSKVTIVFVTSSSSVIVTLLAPAPVNSADSEGTSKGRDDGIQPAT